MDVRGDLLTPQSDAPLRGMILRRFIFLVLSLALPGPAAAQEAPTTGGSFIGRIFDATGLRTAPPPAADFVRESRPQQLDYAPLSPKPEKSGRKSAAELQASGAALDRAAAEARRRAARVKIPN